MSSARMKRAFTVVALLSGCELTAELGSYADAEPETSTTDASNETSTADDESGTGAEDEPGDGDGEPGDGDGDGDGDGLCMIDGFDDPCRTCTKFLCCVELSACDQEAGCNCMLECLVESEPVTCAMTCTPGAAYFSLLQCQVTSCAGVCG